MYDTVVATPTPSERNILSILTRERLVSLGREFGVSVSSRAKKETQIESLTSSGQLRFTELLRILGRDELRAACKANGLDDSGRARAVLATRLLDAHGADANEAPEHIFAPTNDRKDIPHPGDIARVRHRQYQDGTWTCQYPDEEPRSLGSEDYSEPLELILSKKLAEYTDLAQPAKGKGKLVFINLQKRLLSSFEAFHRTLDVHARSVGKANAEASAPRASLFADADEYGVDDDAQEQADASDIERASKQLKTPEARAKELLDELVSLAAQYRRAPDAKVLALLDWIRRHQCAGVRLGGAQGEGQELPWSDTRVILFTEYGDTKRYLWQLLTTAAQRTDRGDERIMQFHGGMSDEQREEVQIAFNGAPDEYPDMPDSWQPTLDALRPPRGRTEPFWEWRRRPPLPVVFRALDKMDSSRVHLHLQHPFVQRILSRFRSQGYSAQDLSRVTIIRNPEDALVRVVAFGRLSLFGPGAVRLHDQLVPVTAKWLESKGKGHLEPFTDRADRKALDLLERLLKEPASYDGVNKTVESRVLASASEDFAAVWPHIQDEADSLAHEAERKLQSRGAEESEALRQIIEAQRAAIENTIEKSDQRRLEFEPADRFEREQFEKDVDHMNNRLKRIEDELETEPRQIEELYKVVLSRLEPIGLVYLWPETRG